jgi:hypothetical protein
VLGLVNDAHGSFADLLAQNVGTKWRRRRGVSGGEGRHGSGRALKDGDDPRPELDRDRDEPVNNGSRRAFGRPVFYVDCEGHFPSPKRTNRQYAP